MTTEFDQYWKRLVSTGLRVLQGQNNTDAVAVIKNATLGVDFDSHDSWDGGIDFWNLLFQLKYRDYMTFRNKKDRIESEILEVLNEINNDEKNVIVGAKIQLMLEQYIDWNAILPATKDSTISMILEQKKMLLDVATGKLSFKEDGVEDAYQNRHAAIVDIAHKVNFNYPVTANTLTDWWNEVKKFPSYAERREYISQMFSPLITLLNESEDFSTDINFQQIATKSGTIQKAVEDAEIFIQQGKYDSAVDRIHTAFQGYLRELLTEHRVNYERDDGIPTLFTKLHTFYRNSIQPPDVAERIKTILRSAGGMINMINELRNNNSIAHPNGNLIKKREAQLVIRLMNALVDYIEEVEDSSIL